MSRFAMSNAVMDVQRPVSSPQPSIDIIPPAPKPPAPNGNQDPSLPPQTPQEQTTKKPGRRKGPIIAIVAVVVVVLLLIAAAVVFYLNSQNKTEEPAAETPTETPLVDDGYVDPADIDAAVQKIDSSLTNLNDSTDFGADDLNDSTLGL